MATESAIQRILLHLCCGPCGTESVRRLRELGEVVLFFSDSNIFPRAEYERRLHEARRLARIAGCVLIEDLYDHEAWRAAVAGLEEEPEKGKRCLKCFEINLSRTARYAEAHGFDAVATSLTVSPHKASGAIFDIGRRVARNFLTVDFKKQDGFRRSLELSRAYGMYRQNYCGCEFSMPKSRSDLDHAP